MGDYCRGGGFEYVTIAFVNESPENGNGYPGTNFGGHCAASVYTNPANNQPTELLSGCTFMAADIPVCQQLGIKVLLSVGGVYSPNWGSNYTVSTVAGGEYFATFLWQAFGPPNSSYTGPRPFDISPTQPNTLDGFDFDIEVQFGKCSASFHSLAVSRCKRVRER